jgi:hypothetical protein
VCDDNKDYSRQDGPDAFQNIHGQTSLVLIVHFIKGRAAVVFHFYAFTSKSNGVHLDRHPTG